MWRGKRRLWAYRAERAAALLLHVRGGEVSNAAGGKVQNIWRLKGGVDFMIAVTNSRKSCFGTLRLASNPFEPRLFALGYARERDASTAMGIWTTLSFPRRRYV